MLLLNQTLKHESDTLLFINDRVDTNEPATSALEHQSHATADEAIVEEDEASAAAASALSAGVTADSQSADSGTVLDEEEEIVYH